MEATLNKLLLPNITQIVTDYLNTVFLLDGDTIYLFNGNKKEFYFKLDKSPTNLVYITSLGLCFKDEDSIRALNLETKVITEIKRYQIKDINEKTALKNTTLIGSSKLYFISYDKIYCYNRNKKCFDVILIYADVKQCVYKNYILSVQGYDFCTKSLGSIKRFNTTNGFVTDDKVLFTCKRTSFKLAVFDDFLYLIGGEITIDRTHATFMVERIHTTFMVERYDLVNKTWTRCSDIPCQLEYYCSIVRIGEYIYFLQTKGMLKYCPKLDKWESISHITFDLGCSAAMIPD